MFYSALILFCLQTVVSADTTVAPEAADSTTHNTLHTSTYTYSGEGCKSMCCDGKNNDCHSRGLRLNGLGSPTSLCFCDEGCPAMGDCCFDYEKACTVVNCEMSEWTDFSECSNSCGFGTKTRHRSILVKPRFGGEPCPQNLKETTICSGSECSKEKVKLEQEIEKETAKIMPARFGRFRNMKVYNADMDIRKNLYYQYYYKNRHTYNGYCSSFRVISSRKACQSYLNPWANVLSKGAIICVECQKTAMENERSNGMCAGHGEVGVSTNWDAVNAPGCTGWWERLEDTDGCTCEHDTSNKSNDFIFV